ncbi:unnamed protein product [Rhodiola kirilowii]
MTFLPKNFLFAWSVRTANIGSVIGKGGAIINQIRQESGAGIKVDSSVEETTLITISAKEYFEDISPGYWKQPLRLQPRCSDKSERDSGIVSFTTRMFVPSSRIGCLIGKGGNIITEIRKLTRANIRILPRKIFQKLHWKMMRWCRFLEILMSQGMHSFKYYTVKG